MGEAAIDVDEAIAQAFAALERFFRDQDLADVRLEEVGRGEGTWEITLGFTVPDNTPDGRPKTFISAMPMQKYTRVYKVFSVDASNGDIVSMKIRQP